MGGSSASEPWWSVKDSDFTINNSEKLRFNREKLWSGHWNNEEWICVCVCMNMPTPNITSLIGNFSVIYQEIQEYLEKMSWHGG